MLVITEYKLTKSTIDFYHSRGYRVCNIFDKPVIKPKESVGFLLDTLYKQTIELIEYLLFTKHTITIKYQDKSYKLTSLDDWKYTHQDEKDCLKQKSDKHPVLLSYEANRREYFDKLRTYNLKKQYKILTEILEDISDEELDNFVRTFAPRYQLDIDLNSKIDKLKAYYQIKYYIDNDIPYSNPAPVIAVDEVPLFKASMFQMDYKANCEEYDVTYFGNEIYLEDTIYKEVEA